MCIQWQPKKTKLERESSRSVQARLYPVEVDETHDQDEERVDGEDRSEPSDDQDYPNMEHEGKEQHRLQRCWISSSIVCTCNIITTSPPPSCCRRCCHVSDACIRAWSSWHCLNHFLLTSNPNSSSTAAYSLENSLNAEKSPHWTRRKMPRKKKKTLSCEIPWRKTSYTNFFLRTQKPNPTTKPKKRKEKLTGECFCSNHSADGTLLTGWLLALCIWELELESAVLWSAQSPRQEATEKQISYTKSHSTQNRILIYVSACVNCWSAAEQRWFRIRKKHDIRDE